VREVFEVENGDRTMPNRYCSLFLSALLSVSSLAIAGGSAGNLPPADIGSLEGNVLALAEIRLSQKERESAIAWDRKAHGERCLYRSGACRLFHDGYYYETPWWGLPLAIGGGIGAVDY
jgi:hypothetical protein